MFNRWVTTQQHGVFRNTFVNPDLFVRVVFPVDKVLEFVSDSTKPGIGTNTKGVGINVDHVSFITPHWFAQLWVNQSTTCLINGIEISTDKFTLEAETIRDVK